MPSDPISNFPIVEPTDTHDNTYNSNSTRSLDLLHGVEMEVTVELGHTKMLLRDLLDLSPGSVVELDRSAGSAVDVLVNGTLIARGEVVVVDDDFGVRISEVITEVNTLAKGN